MAKGIVVTNEVKALIASVYKDHPTWKAPRVHKEVGKVLRKEAKAQGKIIAKGWPGLHIVQKELATVRKKAKTPPVNDEEQPWGIATLDDYPIAAPALPVVLKEYKRLFDEGRALTVRQAKWLARLSATELALMSYHIARTEEMYEMADLPLNLEVFDKLLAGLPGTSNNWQIPFAAIASLSGILENDITKGGK